MESQTKLDPHPHGPLGDAGKETKTDHEVEKVARDAYGYGKTDK